ncbi:MAG: SAM-dependent methyltransferase, partial [Alphaproteobacteria bacterium]
MKPPLAAVALLSAAAIGYEVLLARLFAITLWHHFAFMIISVALLGVGASGTFLAFARGALERRFAGAFATAAVLFGVSAVAGFAAAQRVPFNPLEVIWDLRQQAYLLQIYLVLALPFFAAATAIGLTLARFGGRIAAVYRADLAGAGGGALAVVLALFALPPDDCLRLIGGLGLLAAALAVGSRRLAAALAVAAVASAAAWPASWLAPLPSPYKGLSRALTVPDARVVAERSSPLGLLTVVDSPTVPFRHAPGLSLVAGGEPPAQLAVFTDADALTVITRFDGDPAALGHLDRQTAALPFHLLDRPRTLVLGAGGGSDVLRALYHGVPAVDAVELNPQLVDLVRGPYRDFAGGVYDRAEVAVHVAEARAFVEASSARWDLIQVALLDSFTAAAAGVQALSESPLYTVEALDAYVGHLAPGGMLAITRWLRVPPRDSLKLFATAVVALERAGVAAPERRLAAIRGWNTVTLVVKNGDLTAEDTSALRAFAAARSFDAVWYPGMPRDEANRYNLLAEPYLHDGARALLGPQRQRFIDGYKFHIAPATDDRPYHFRFFRWVLVPELPALARQGGLTLLDSGYLVLLATLLQAVVVGLVLILLPLVRLAAPGGGTAGLARWRVAVYFLALGLAFLFVEIAFIHRLTVFLGHPLAAIAVVLAGFLGFAGLGSGASARLAGDRPRVAVALAVAGLITIAAIELGLLPLALPALAGWGLAAKALVALAAIAPLAFAMGMPFPLGLGMVTRRAPHLVPWAWGINGCASVIGAVLASLLAMHVGFTMVVVLATGLYAAAAAV